jgi:hypothetical protein
MRITLACGESYGIYSRLRERLKVLLWRIAAKVLPLNSMLGSRINLDNDCCG